MVTNKHSKFNNEVSLAQASNAVRVVNFNNQTRRSA